MLAIRHAHLPANICHIISRISQVAYVFRIMNVRARAHTHTQTYTNTQLAARRGIMYYYICGIPRYIIYYIIILLSQMHY